MSKQCKTWLKAAAVLMIVGITAFVVVMSLYNWDFQKLNTVEYVTSEYSFSETVYDISVDIDHADVRILPAEDGSCKVICREEADMPYEVDLQNGKLSVKAAELRWYEYLGRIALGKTHITVYLPREQYGALRIHSKTGDVTLFGELVFESLDISVNTADMHLDHLSCCGEAKIRVNTGDVSIADFQCGDLRFTGNTGDLELTRVSVRELFRAKSNTGDVEFLSCKAGEISVDINTGDVTGSLVGEMVFSVKTNTGDIEVPDSAKGGRCKITANTGDIKITLE